MSLIPVVTSSGMTIEQGVICKCDVCRHRWLPEGTNEPKRCAKCKSRLWNRKAKKTGPKARPPKQGKAKHKKGR